MLPPKFPIVIRFINHPTGVCRQPVCACCHCKVLVLSESWPQVKAGSVSTGYQRDRPPNWSTYRTNTKPLNDQHRSEEIEVRKRASHRMTKIIKAYSITAVRLSYNTISISEGTQQVKGWAPHAAGEKSAKVKTVRNSITWTWGPTSNQSELNSRTNESAEKGCESTHVDMSWTCLTCPTSNCIKLTYHRPWLRKLGIRQSKSCCLTTVLKSLVKTFDCRLVHTSVCTGWLSSH